MSEKSRLESTLFTHEFLKIMEVDEIKREKNKFLLLSRGFSNFKNFKA